MAADSPRFFVGLSTPGRIVLAYVAVGTAWILGSDWLVGTLMTEPAVQRSTQTVKGLVFIGITAVFVYWLAGRSLRDMRRTLVADRLRSTERLLDTVLASVGEAVIVIDPAGRLIRHCNAAAERMFGYPRDELLGNSTERLHVDRETFVDFGERSRVVLAGGRAFRDELQMRRRDGQVFDAEVTVTALHEQEGWTAGVVSVVRDITARKRAEVALRDSAERLAHITATSPAILYVLEPGDGRFPPRWVSDNVTAILGYSVEAALAPGWWRERLHDEDREAALQRSASLLRDRQIAHEYRFRRADGEWIWIRDHARVVERDGRTEIMGAWLDVTQRRALENQLLQAQKMESVGRLAGGVAHDFNNLITVILGSADMARAEVPPGGRTSEALLEIRQAAESAAGLTRQLLAFSRRQVVQPRVFGVNAKLRGMERMVQRLIGEDIRMSMVTRASPDTVRADPAQLEQVLLNLVVNSRDAMPDGGQLDIETGNAPVGDGAATPGVTIAVRDSGQGMDDRVKARVFEPFFTTKEPGRGTGLGLSTVYGIVTQCGGSVRIESAPGAGATFIVHLPLAVQAPAAEATPSLSPLPSGRETVLVVEDDRHLRELVRRYLGSAGYQVLTAAHPEEALHVTRAHAGAIDLLLTDVVLPGLRGPALAARIREACPGIRVMYMSGYAGDTVDLQSAVAAGAWLLAKPFDLAELGRTVRQVLDATTDGHGSAGA